MSGKARERGSEEEMQTALRQEPGRASVLQAPPEGQPPGIPSIWVPTLNLMGTKHDSL